MSLARIRSSSEDRRQATSINSLAINRNQSLESPALFLPMIRKYARERHRRCVATRRPGSVREFRKAEANEANFDSLEIAACEFAFCSPREESAPRRLAANRRGLITSSVALRPPMTKLRERTCSRIKWTRARARFG